eukprot:1924000-Amphidinium_carterae.1
MRPGFFGRTNFCRFENTMNQHDDVVCLQQVYIVHETVSPLRLAEHLHHTNPLLSLRFCGACF